VLLYEKPQCEHCIPKEELLWGPRLAWMAFLAHVALSAILSFALIVEAGSQEWLSRITLIGFSIAVAWVPVRVVHYLLWKHPFVWLARDDKREVHCHADRDFPGEAFRKLREDYRMRYWCMLTGWYFPFIPSMYKEPFTYMAYRYQDNKPFLTLKKGWILSGGERWALDPPSFWHHMQQEASDMLGPELTICSLQGMDDASRYVRMLEKRDRVLGALFYLLLREVAWIETSKETIGKSKHGQMLREHIWAWLTKYAEVEYDTFLFLTRKDIKQEHTELAYRFFEDPELPDKEIAPVIRSKVEDLEKIAFVAKEHEGGD
jgi:hypothetical protein